MIGIVPWIRRRLPISGDQLRELTNEPVPNHLKRWWFCLGGTPAYLFVVQIVTGILLAFYYEAAPGTAYESVRYITNDVAYGWYIRGIHKWGATLMIAAVILHQMRVYFTGAYRFPREMNWMVGMLILLCVLTTGFTGYSLVYEQLSFWGATVAGNITASVPLLGEPLAKLMLAGEGYNSHTLSRFFILHGAVLPSTIVVLLIVHITLIRLQGVTEFKSEGAAPRDDGHFNFFPDHILTEIMMGLVLMILLSALATIFPAVMGPKADPTVTPELIKPEWYFYVTFRWLKLFSGTAAVLSMGFIVFVMFFWPFIDGWIRKNTPAKEASVWIGILAVLAIIGLTVWKQRSPTDSAEKGGRPPRIKSQEEVLVSLNAKQYIIGALGFLFLASLVFVQFVEHERRKSERGEARHVEIPDSSKECVDCHSQSTRGLVDHWTGSTHAEKGVGCVECHQAEADDADSFEYYGERIATIVTPRDCGRCHSEVVEEFSRSHHAKGGNILHSLDNLLAETVEGHRTPFSPHGPTPGFAVTEVNGMASAIVGCHQCHGSKVALQSVDGTSITVDDLKPGPDGKPTNLDAVAKIRKDSNNRPLYDPATWPNTGIGRLNLDGSRGSCSACHSRHDFSPRRARQPENCGKCHLGPDHPQKEIYEESKHGVAYRDLRDEMNLDAADWVLGEDYSQAPTCATCHMSGHSRNGGKITHDPGERISWTNRPPISLRMDTDINHAVVKETDPEARRRRIVDTADAKRDRMKAVCGHCHTQDYINGFYKQYDDFVVLYNEKFAKPGQAIVKLLKSTGIITQPNFDEEIEWTWFYLWHHEGRRARHGASMMAPDYAHWHGMYEVAERFYMELIPQARELVEHARLNGHPDEANQVAALIDEILARPEHQWKAKK